MIEHIRSHAMLIEKRDRLVREGRPVPEDIFTIGELVRRNRPAMGVRR